MCPMYAKSLNIMFVNANVHGKLLQPPWWFCIHCVCTDQICQAASTLSNQMVIHFYDKHCKSRLF